MGSEHSSSLLSSVPPNHGGATGAAVDTGPADAAVSGHGQKDATPDIAEQCRLVNESDTRDIQLQNLMEEALHDIEGWTA